MPTSRSIKFLRLFVISGVLHVLSTNGHAIDIYSDTVPQAQVDTCQSYAMVLALAAKGDPAFPITTFEEIRQGEADFRQIAAGIPGGPFGHEALKQAVSNYTSGAYRLAVEYPGTDLVAWLSRVRALTTLDGSADALIGRLTGQKFPVVLTSVTRFGDSTYPRHIMSILGLIGSGLNSNTQLLAFNSAIKGQGGSVNRCVSGTQPGDERYKAGVVSTNNFTLNEFNFGQGPKYVIMHLERN
jgi:hypothetical protein